MYTIKNGSKAPLSYVTRESAMKAWDKFCDNAEGGDVLVLKHPKGSISVNTIDR